MLVFVSLTPTERAWSTFTDFAAPLAAAVHRENSSLSVESMVAFPLLHLRTLVLCRDGVANRTDSSVDLSVV